jgi:phosphotransferase system enzyme I (PtsI)
MGKGHSIPNKPVDAVLRGTASAPGIAYGPAFIYNPAELILSDEIINHADIREEQARIDSAVRVVELEIRKIEQLSKETDLDDQSVAILEFQRSILKDPDLIGSINQNIRSEYMPADRAIYQAFRYYIDRLKNIPNAYFRERIPDIRDIRDRMIRTTQRKQLLIKIDDDSIVVCKDLSPGDIILFARKKVKAIVSEQGGLTSHASIIANSMGIPFVIGVDGLLGNVEADDIVLVHGTNGYVVLNPTKARLTEIDKEIEIENQIEITRQQIAEEPAQTACGRQFIIQANVELESELDRVQLYKSDGIGLLRTEAYFLDSNDSEQTSNGHAERDQRSFLERAAKVCGEHNLTVRLYDVGGDKLPNYAKEEANPFLGWRGLRILLDKPALMKSQLDLIFSTAVNYPCKLSIMLPMVTDAGEVKDARKIFEEVLVNYPDLTGKVKFGIMIEVPSAALLADKLAPLVDFFSIGTNDLTQYTLAADRTNRHVQKLYNQMHPSVWRLISQTCDAAHACNIPVSVCGEIAGKPVAAALLIGLGVDRLSMTASAIPAVKEFLSKHEFATLSQAAHKISEAATIDEVDSVLSSFLGT